MKDVHAVQNNSQYVWTYLEDKSVWQYKSQNEIYKGWIFLNNSWFYLDNNTGYMKTSWVQTPDGKWYFFDTRKESEGRLLSSWQWIDGYCYYFEKDDARNIGQLYTSKRTPDNNLVDSSGRWVNESGIPYYYAGRGIQTKNTKLNSDKSGRTDTKKSSGGGSGSSGRRGSSGGGSGSSGRGGSSGGRDTLRVENVFNKNNIQEEKKEYTPKDALSINTDIAKNDVFPDSSINNVGTSTDNINKDIKNIVSPKDNALDNSVPESKKVNTEVAIENPSIPIDTTIKDAEEKKDTKETTDISGNTSVDEVNEDKKDSTEEATENSNSPVDTTVKDTEEKKDTKETADTSDNTSSNEVSEDKKDNTDVVTENPSTPVDTTRKDTEEKKDTKETNDSSDNASVNDVNEGKKDNEGSTDSAVDNNTSDDSDSKNLDGDITDDSKKKTKEESIIELLSSGRNQNVDQFTNDEGEIRTVLWVDGINAPTLGKDGDFKRKNYNTYVDYHAPYLEGNSWYDVNKSKGENGEQLDDRSMCFAAVSSNALHWWLDQNKDYIDRYIEKEKQLGNLKDEEVKSKFDIRDYRDSFIDQQNSKIFSFFKVHFANKRSGFYSDILVDFFINGYTPKVGGGTNIEDASMVPNSSAGFLHKVFKEKKLTKRFYRGNYSSVSREIRESLSNSEIIGLGHIIGGYTHVVTVWGAEYDLDGNLVGIYITDSDDQNENNLGMKRYDVKNVDGYARIGTDRDPKNKGKDLAFIETISLGTELWDKYFEEN